MTEKEESKGEESKEIKNERSEKMKIIMPKRTKKAGKTRQKEEARKE